MLSIYLPLSDSQISDWNGTNKKFWIKRKADAQKRLGDERLHKDQRNEEKKISESETNSVLEAGYFGLAAVAISLLFAIHFGLIPVQSSHAIKKVSK